MAGMDFRYQICTHECIGNSSLISHLEFMYFTRLKIMSVSMLPWNYTKIIIVIFFLLISRPSAGGPLFPPTFITFHYLASKIHHEWLWKREKKTFWPSLLEKLPTPLIDVALFIETNNMFTKQWWCHHQPSSFLLR